MAFADPALVLTEQPFDGVLVVAVAGDLHVSTAPELSERLTDVIDSGARRIVLDLAALEFIDSTGLSVLLSRAAARARRRRPDGVGLREPDGAAAVRDHTRLDATFDIHRRREDAIAALRAADG